MDLVNYIDKRLLVFYHHCVENNYAVLKVSTANSGPDRNRPSKLPENRYYSCCYSQSLKPWSSKKTRQKKPYSRVGLFFIAEGETTEAPILPFNTYSELSEPHVSSEANTSGKKKKNVFLISKGDIEAPAGK